MAAWPRLSPGLPARGPSPPRRGSAPRTSGPGLLPRPQQGPQLSSRPPPRAGPRGQRNRRAPGPANAPGRGLYPPTQPGLRGARPSGGNALLGALRAPLDGARSPGWQSLKGFGPEQQKLGDKRWIPFCTVIFRSSLLPRPLRGPVGRRQAPSTGSDISVLGAGAAAPVTASGQPG